MWERFLTWPKNTGSVRLNCTCKCRGRGNLPGRRTLCIVRLSALWIRFVAARALLLSLFDSDLDFGLESTHGPISIAFYRRLAQADPQLLDVLDGFLELEQTEEETLEQILW